MTVKDLVLENDDRVGVTDSGLSKRSASSVSHLIDSISKSVLTHLEETTAVLSRVGRDDLETRDLTVPCCRYEIIASVFQILGRGDRDSKRTSVILGVLSSDTSSSSVRTTENNRAGNVSAREKGL